MDIQNHQESKIALQARCKGTCENDVYGRCENDRRQLAVFILSNGHKRNTWSGTTQLAHDTDHDFKHPQNFCVVLSKNVLHFSHNFVVHLLPAWYFDQQKEKIPMLACMSNYRKSSQTDTLLHNHVELVICWSFVRKYCYVLLMLEIVREDMKSTGTYVKLIRTTTKYGRRWLL